VFRKGVARFDGMGDYLVLPATESVRSLTVWLYLDGAQPACPAGPTACMQYLLDARVTESDPYYYSTRCVPPIIVKTLR
jgi:hypothetical protein